MGWRFSAGIELSFEKPTWLEELGVDGYVRDKKRQPPFILV